MVGFENGDAIGQLFRVLRLLLPGQIENPVQIPGNHRIFGGGRLHFIQPVQFFEALFLHFLGQALGEDLCAVFVLLFPVVAQFAVNGLELLAQEIILLRAVDVLTDGGGDFLFDFGDLQLVVEAAFKQFEPLDDGILLEDLLLDFQAHPHGGHGHVDVSIGVGARLQLREDIFPDLPVCQQDVPHHFPRGAEIRFFENFVPVHGQNFVRDGVIVSRFKLYRPRAGAVEPFRQHAQGPARKLGHLFDARDGADGVDVRRRNFVLFGLPLRADKDQPVGRGRRAFDGLQRDIPAHLEGNEGAGKRHLPPQGNDGQYICFRHFFDKLFHIIIITPRKDFSNKFRLFRKFPPLRRLRFRKRQNVTRLSQKAPESVCFFLLLYSITHPGRKSKGGNPGSRPSSPKFIPIFAVPSQSVPFCPRGRRKGRPQTKKRPRRAASLLLLYSP